MAKLVIKTDISAEQILAERARRLKPNGPPIRLTPMQQAVQFLRGVHSRATLTLPVFYLYPGSTADGEPPCSIAGSPGLILKHSLQYSSIGTIALSCRQAFFDATTDLTGPKFSRLSDSTLTEVAEYWANSSGRPSQDAYAALDLLRSVFRDCAKAKRS
jgi:hypothetical protein